MASIDPQDFGLLQGKVIGLADNLDKHVAECSEASKQMAAALQRLVDQRNNDKLRQVFAVGIIIGSVLARDQILGLMARVLGP